MFLRCFKMFQDFTSEHCHSVKSNCRKPLASALPSQATGKPWATQPRPRDVKMRSRNTTFGQKPEKSIKCVRQKLVGGIPTPLKKYEWKSVGMMTFHCQYMESHKNSCSKPPTRKDTKRSCLWSTLSPVAAVVPALLHRHNTAWGKPGGKNRGASWFTQIPLSRNLM